MLSSETSGCRPDDTSVPRHDGLVALERLWNSRRKNGRLPSKADFPPSEIKQWLGHIMLTDVSRTPLRFRVRLMGVILVEYAGTDHTGKWFDEMFEGERLARNLHPYLMCIDTKAPCYDNSAVIQRYGKRIPIQRLHLPCADDGETVNVIIGCAYPLGETPRA